MIMACGGTGGHIFPAIALADEFKRKESGWDLVFVGSRGGIEERVVPEKCYRLELLDVEGVRGRSGMEMAKSLYKVANSTLSAVKLLRRLKPDGVIGYGSYSSAPVVLAAALLRIKTAILEQNLLPGMTNRFLGRFVDRIYVSFEETRGYFPAGNVIHTGNPIRREIYELAGAMEMRGAMDERRVPFTILVFGGSQGAKAINTAFLDALEYLTDIIGSIRIIHQTGTAGYDDVMAAYKRKGLFSDRYRERLEVRKFIDDISSSYRMADLVICRAGATSIAEITALGLASILIPYPFAADNHQEVNAQSLSDKGAAFMLKQEGLTGRVLADTIRRFYERPDVLKEMESASKALGRTEALDTIIDDYIGLLGS